MSKPLSASEPWMKTETRSWVPTVPLIVRGLEGHELELVGIMQTVPVNCPWAGVSEGMRKTVPRSNRTEEYSIFLVMFFAYFQNRLGVRDNLRVPDTCGSFSGHGLPGIASVCSG